MAINHHSGNRARLRIDDQDVLIIEALVEPKTRTMDLTNFCEPEHHTLQRLGITLQSPETTRLGAKGIWFHKDIRNLYDGGTLEAYVISTVIADSIAAQAEVRGGLVYNWRLLSLGVPVEFAMPDKAFARKIEQDPFDPLNYLIYADYVQERGGDDTRLRRAAAMIEGRLAPTRT